MINFPTRIPDFCDSHSPTLLDLFLLMLVFVSRRFSCHWKFWSCYYLSFQMGMSLFIAQLMAISVLTGMVIWEILHCRTSLNSVFLLLVLDFVSGSMLELMYIYLVANICSSILCCCYGHRNNLFRLNQESRSSASKVKFRQAGNLFERVTEAVKLTDANKTKENLTSQKLGSRGF